MAIRVVDDRDKVPLPTYITSFDDTRGWYQAYFDGDPPASWRCKRPRLYYPANLQYSPVDEYVAVDGMGREWSGEQMFECTINPASGKFAPLCVQTRNSFCALKNSTWDRTIIRSSAPRLLRLSAFPFQGIHWSKRYKPEEWDRKDWASVAWRWLPGSLGIIILLFLSSPSRPKGKDPRAYLPFRYNGYRYPRVARNFKENRKEIFEQHLRDPSWIADGATPAYRAFRPRYLCYISETVVKGPNGEDETVVEFDTRPVGRNDHTPYVFISYTKMQFDVEDDEAASEGNYANLYGWILRAVTEYTECVKDDFEKPRAFWLDKECMPHRKFDEETGTEYEVTEPRDIKELTDYDVYTMSDIIREAETTIVIVRDHLPAGAYSVAPSDKSTNNALMEWGGRAWTLPEALLAKSTSVMLVDNGKPPEQVSKVRLAEIAWKDAGTSRQLVEHFTNLNLSRLELVSVAIKCLEERTLQGSGHLGYRAYILMGLLRVRPPIDTSDSSFQAFARLSLPQDSDRLMERLICLLPKDPDEPWDKMSDQYSSSLWDIYPDVQVCGVGENDTVVVDGFKGAMIQWWTFQNVQMVTRMTFYRLLIIYGVAFSPLFLFLGIILLAVGKATSGLEASVADFSVQGFTDPNSGLLGAGGFFLAFALLILLSSPLHLPRLFSGKFHEVEPCLFGIEGYVPLQEVEEKLFGLRVGRLKWGPYGSPLSRHTYRKSYRELTDEVDVEAADSQALLSSGGAGVNNNEVWTYPVEAMDPCSYCQNCENGGNQSGCQPPHLTFATAESMSKSRFGEMKLFTLIDTCSMTATLFEARRPPVALIVGGSEGGMKRALACSYDVTTGTMYRETVLRVPTQTIDAMHSLPRVRLGLKNPHKPNTVMLVNNTAHIGAAILPRSTASWTMKTA